MESVTDMHNCIHGPKRDCHACLVGELVEALKPLAVLNVWVPNNKRIWNDDSLLECKIKMVHARNAAAVLEKAKLVESRATWRKP